jgi:hypothetical protein
LEVATSRAADAAIDLREAQDTGAGMGEPESPDVEETPVLPPFRPPPARSYAAAKEPVRVPATRACAAALAKAEERATEILITRTPEVTTHGLATLTPKEIVVKARLAMEAARARTGDETAPVSSAVVGARVLRSGDVVLQMSSAQAADWQRQHMSAFLDAMGGTSALKHRHTTLVVEYVPTSFDPSVDGALRILEDDNNLGRGSITSARFIKAAERRRSGQRVAHIMLALSSEVSANRVIRHGIFIEGKKVWGRKLLPEPVRCLKCQSIGAGHLANTCPSIHDTCARCGEMHRTAACTVGDNERACSNCRRARMQYQGHGAADRSCPFFTDKLQFSLECNPDAPFKYFLTRDPETWETHREADGRPETGAPWQQGNEWRSAWAESAGKKGGTSRPAAPGLGCVEAADV